MARKWVLRGSVATGFLGSLLVAIVLSPRLAYAHHTAAKAYTVYHQQPLAPQVFTRLGQATALLRTSEFYQPGQSFDICLNDGSAYPTLLRRLRGPAFAWGFANKVVLQGQANFSANCVVLNGYRWNAAALLAHELTHCLQASALGVWHSNPMARLPEWKWEGYAEYVSRPHGSPQALRELLRRLRQADQQPAAWALLLADGTIAPIGYARYQALVQYCLDVRHLSYRQLLTDTATAEEVARQVASWEANVPAAIQ